MEVRTARKRERKVVSEILAAAFADDPVVRWALPTAGHDSRMFLALATYIHAAPGCADLALEDARPWGAALWDPSSNIRNVPLYQRFGFEVIQEISLPEDGPTLWTMLRP
jgi:hypothetical protein